MHTSIFLMLLQKRILEEWVIKFVVPEMGASEKHIWPAGDPVWRIHALWFRGAGAFFSALISEQFYLWLFYNLLIKHILEKQWLLFFSALACHKNERRCPSTHHKQIPRSARSQGWPQSEGSAACRAQFFRPESSENRRLCWFYNCWFSVSAHKLAGCQKNVLL